MHKKVNPSVLGFKKFPVAKKFMDKRGGGVSRFSIEIFLFHSAENFPRGESFSVSLISGIEKVCIGRGEYQDLPSKIICLTVPKNFVGEPFCVSLTSGTEKVWIRREGEYQDFPSKIICLTVPKKFVGKHFCVSLISGTEKVYG